MPLSLSATPSLQFGYALALALWALLSAGAWQAGIASKTTSSYALEAPEQVHLVTNKSTPPRETSSGIGWHELSTAQKRVLYPLAERWAWMGDQQKRRWLALALNFPDMPVAEQEKVRGRMFDWSKLSAQQRSQARLNFAVTRQFSADEKRAQWEAYQALSEDDKRILAKQAPPKAQGAAIALQPARSQKFVEVKRPPRPNSQATPKATEASNPAANTPVLVNTPAAAAGNATEGTAAVPGSVAPASTSGNPAVQTDPVNMPSAAPLPLPALSSHSSGPATEGAGFTNGVVNDNSSPYTSN